MNFLGDISRLFRRTKCYDSLLTALVGAGIRILFSSGQEETADLLKELSLVEQRKNVGIHVPAVLNPRKCEALQFYLSIPGISYITALNMCHRVSSVKKMANRYVCFTGIFKWSLLFLKKSLNYLVCVYICARARMCGHMHPPPATVGPSESPDSFWELVLSHHVKPQGSNLSVQAWWQTPLAILPATLLWFL